MLTKLHRHLMCIFSTRTHLTKNFNLGPGCLLQKFREDEQDEMGIREVEMKSQGTRDAPPRRSPTGHEAISSIFLLAYLKFRWSDCFAKSGEARATQSFSFRPRRYTTSPFSCCAAAVPPSPALLKPRRARGDETEGEKRSSLHVCAPTNHFRSPL